jgi:YVTN family beta-propeller protein
VLVDGTPDTAGVVARQPDWGLDNPDPAGSGPPRALLAVTAEVARVVGFFNADTKRPLGAAPVGWAPREIAVAPDRNTLFVVNAAGDRFGMGSISIVSVDQRKEIERLDLYPYGRVHGLAVTRAGVFLYVACEERRAVLEYNLLARRIDRTFTLPSGVPHLMVLNDTETRLFVTDAAGPHLYAIDLAGGRITEATVGESPEGLALSPDGMSLWVANRDDGTVSLLDPNTLALQGTLAAGRAPVRIAFTPDGNRALVVNAGESSVAVFEPRSRGRLASIAVAGYPLGIAIDGSGERAWVASTRDYQLSVLDLRENRVVDQIPVGTVPIEVVWIDRR